MASVNRNDHFQQDQPEEPVTRMRLNKRLRVSGDEATSKY